MKSMVSLRGRELSTADALTEHGELWENCRRSVWNEFPDGTHEDGLNLETSTSRGFEKHTFDAFDRQRCASRSLREPSSKLNVQRSKLFGLRRS